MTKISGSAFSFRPMSTNNTMLTNMQTSGQSKFSGLFQEAKKQAAFGDFKTGVKNQVSPEKPTIERTPSRPRNDVRLPPNGEIQTIETDLSRKLEKLEAQGVDVGEIIRSGGTLPEPEVDHPVSNEPTITEPQVAFDIALPIPLDANGNPQTVSLGNPETDTLTPSLPEEIVLGDALEPLEQVVRPVSPPTENNPADVELVIELPEEIVLGDALEPLEQVVRPVSPPTENNPADVELVIELPEEIVLGDALEPLEQIISRTPPPEPFDIALPLPLDANGNPQIVTLNNPSITPIILGAEQPAAHKPEVQAEATRRNIFNFVVSS